MFLIKTGMVLRELTPIDANGGKAVAGRGGCHAHPLWPCGHLCQGYSASTPVNPGQLQSHPVNTPSPRGAFQRGWYFMVIKPYQAVSRYFKPFQAISRKKDCLFFVGRLRSNAALPYLRRAGDCHALPFQSVSKRFKGFQRSLEKKCVQGCVTGQSARSKHTGVSRRPTTKNGLNYISFDPNLGPQYGSLL